MKMYYRDHSCEVEIYSFDLKENKALIYSPNIASKQNGNGWLIVKINKLIPLEYCNDTNANFISKTKKNQIKSMLTLSHAIWTATDGMEFDHAHLEDAIQHQANLIKEKVIK